MTPSAAPYREDVTRKRITYPTWQQEPQRKGLRRLRKGEPSEENPAIHQDCLSSKQANKKTFKKNTQTHSLRDGYKDVNTRIGCLTHGEEGAGQGSEL